MITKSKVKQYIIQAILDEECPKPSPFPLFPMADHLEALDRCDVERQALVLRCGWNNMTAEQLLAGLSE